MVGRIGDTSLARARDGGQAAAKQRAARRRSPSTPGRTYLEQLDTGADTDTDTGTETDADTGTETDADTASNRPGRGHGLGRTPCGIGRAGARSSVPPTITLLA
jgi:hypothetical protein